jgi:signal transduction histidine kinase/CheY-like chemotaxis protein/ligand-binding sensor domain-containing protein
MRGFVRRILLSNLSCLWMTSAAFASEPGSGSASRSSLFQPESGRPVIRDFRPTEYRGHPQVFDVVQGHHGFIYIGNQEGMIEFDGARWTHYAMPSAHVYELAPSADGRIWAGGNHEIGYFDPNLAGGWTYQSLLPQLPAASLPWGRTVHVRTWRDAVYYSGPRGILRVRNNQFTHWPIPPGSRATLHLAHGQLYTHITGEGLYKIEDRGPTLLSNEAHWKESGRFISAPLRDGRVLFCISFSGAYTFNPSTGIVTQLTGPLNDTVATARVNDAIATGDGTIAIATTGHGVLLASSDLSAVRRLDRSSGLADNSIISVAADNEGGLWLGYNSGAGRISLTGNVTVFDATNGPTPGTIDIWGRHEGRLYVGTFDGLYRLEPPTEPGHGSRFVRINANLSNVFGIESYDGMLLVASAQGLSRIDADGNDERLLNLPHNAPFVLLSSPRTSGRFYLGGHTGFTVVQHDAQGWHIVSEKLEMGDSHTAVMEDDGTIWLGTYSRGFWRIPQADTITDWHQATYENYHEGQGMPDNVVWTNVSPGTAGTVLFTDKGSLRFDPISRTFKPDDRYVFPDGSLPMFTPTVVSGTTTWGSVFRESTLIASAPLARVTFDRASKPMWESASQDALQEIGFGGAAVMWVEPTPRGDILWARGYNNTIRLDLSVPETRPASWPAMIRSFSAEGLRVPLPATTDSVSRIRFSREPIVFDLAAPHHGALTGLRFQTRLLGYSDHWSELTETPRVTFTNLEGGPFTLEVRAVDAMGSMSDTAQLTFSVAPPWHRHPFAYVAYAALLLGAIFAFVRRRLAAARREQHRLEQLVDARTSDLAVARDQADAANRAKSAFLAHMSHELRTPLNGVIGYSQVLLNDRAVLGPQRERINIVHASGKHLLKLINEVLDFSKIEAGKIERHDAAFHFAQLIREISSLHAPAAAAKALKFITPPMGSLPEFVLSDAQKLRQVLDNLLSNAVKFTPRGQVELSIEPAAGDAWTFRVRDTGVGLSAEEVAHLFQPFAQAASRPANTAGTGLGLVITRRLVELLGGELQLESTPGRGSVFSFTLNLPPAALPTSSSRPSLAPAGYHGPTRHVVIVDDHEVNRTLFAALLTPLGFQSTAYASADAALAALDHTPVPDIAFIDILMPSIDGLELTRRLRARAATASMPIVLTSASVLTYDATAAERAGANGFLPKPFDETQLHALLTRLLDLTWQSPEANIAAASTSAETLAPERLDPLRTAADAGDITALRAAIRAARVAQPHASTFLDQLEMLAASYQLERVRDLLRTLTP